MSVAENPGETGEAATLPFVEMLQQDRPVTPAQVLPLTNYLGFYALALWPC